MRVALVTAMTGEVIQVSGLRRRMIRVSLHHPQFRIGWSPEDFSALSPLYQFWKAPKARRRRGKDEKFARWVVNFILIPYSKQAKALALQLCQNG
jgi:hypothetical protein